MERLTSLDGIFLAVEDAVNRMNIGSAALFDGPAPSVEAVHDVFAAKIPLVPRCRQRVREPAGLFGPRVWIDDVDFDLRDHLHLRSLPDPEALEETVAELLTRPLDRARALWEVWIIDGLSGDRWAIVAIVHHCMVDGIAGSDLLSVILDRSPSDGTVAPEAWIPTPEPSRRAFARFSVATAVRSGIAHLRRGTEALRHLRRSWRHLRDISTAAKRLWYHQGRPRTSLTGPIGVRRRWTCAAVALEDVVAVRDALGGTVNDVVVAAVTSGFRELLLARGEPVEGRVITALVPVSLRGAGERQTPGNLVANVHALLPVGEPSPQLALQAVRDHLEELKDSHEVEATGLLLHIGDYVPRVVADHIARKILRGQRNVETVITNVPGPRSPRYLAGRRMIAGYPIAPIGGHVRITVAVWSYCDRLHLGITGDRDTVPDLDHLQRAITRGFADLLAAARPPRSDPDLGTSAPHLPEP